MPKFRSKTTTEGRNMAGARALWRATGMIEKDFNKPIIAVVNSFSEFVPGHIHLNEIGRIVCRKIKESGGVAKEFNTIAIDDGIAMGHSGMLYSLPSRDLIADSVEYMVNAHCADAMICISNCDKITPGMFMAALRINIPTIFVSGGPMEAGKIFLDEKNNKIIKLDLVDAISNSANKNISDNFVKKIELSSCPTCGSCSGMFTANSMNCLMEAIGLALPGNGTILATHIMRKKLIVQSSKKIVELTKQFYEKNDYSVLPRSIANIKSFKNAMCVDIAMGGSTNTILHLLAAAREGNVDFTMNNIDILSRKIPNICKLSPSTNLYHIEDFHRAGGVMGILSELNKKKLIFNNVKNVLHNTLLQTLQEYDITITDNQKIKKMYLSAPKGERTVKAFSQSCEWENLDLDRMHGCIRSCENAYSFDGGLAILYGNIAKHGCVVKTAGVDEDILYFSGIAKVYESQEDAVYAILNKKIISGDVIVIRYEGPKGGPGMQEMLYPTTYLKSVGLDKKCALITDGRFSGGTSGLSIGHISPEAASKGLIALIRNGDNIIIDIPNRKITLNVNKQEIQVRTKNELDKGINSYKPIKRNRKISYSLKNYSIFATSADQGAVRDKNKVDSFL